MAVSPALAQPAAENSGPTAVSVANKSVPPNELSTEDLIAALQDEAVEGIGTHSTAWATGFLAIDEEPKFQGGILGSHKPARSAIMQELVRRGTAALPILLDHLTDLRPTKLTVGKGFAACCFSDEYAARYPDRPIPEVNTKLDRGFAEYTLRVGDLCFVAVGQIVNRPLNAVRYQPSLCLVVNSPVETPALAAAVKADWNGLTASEHRTSLERDGNDPRDPGGGLKRLSFYYPAVGESLVLQSLNRPFYDKTLVIRFFEHTLSGGKSEPQRQALLQKFRMRHGEANYAGLIRWLRLAETFPDSQITPARQKQKELAESVLNEIFPGGDRLNAPAFVNAADFSDQARLVEDLMPIRSKAIDGSVFELLQRTAATPLADEPDIRFQQCTLIIACASRLSEQKEYSTPCRAILEQRISDLSKAVKQKKNAAARGAIRRDSERMREALRKRPVAEKPGSEK